MTRLLPLLSLLLGLLWGAGAVRAQGQPPPCSAAVDMKAFLEECRSKAQLEERKGRLPSALAIYQQAYQKVPTPRLLLPIAEVHLQLRQQQEARQALRRYAEEIPPAEQPPEQREQADRLERELQQQEAAVASRSAAETSLSGTEPRPLFRVWKWAALGSGLALLGVGAGLLAVDGRPTCDIEPKDLRCPKLLDTGTTGIALLSIGSAAIAGGLVMVVVDGIRTKRAPRAAK